MHPKTGRAGLVALILFSAGLRAAGNPPAPVFADDFESGLNAWKCPWPGKQPLLLRPAPDDPGNHCACSGPPGRCRVGEHRFETPFTGRVELRFYDDMAPAKHQIAGVGDGTEILGIVCRGGAHYQWRVGHTYRETPVARSKGWHRFAWEIGGRKTRAFIDGVAIGSNPRLGFVRSLFIGSFWDASTGWYDDVQATPSPPVDAPWHVAGKDRWSHDDQKTVWLLKAPAPGAAFLMVGYDPSAAGRAVDVRCGDAAGRLRFAAVSPGKNSGVAVLPVRTAAKPVFVSLRSGRVTPLWLALVPADAATPPDEYARELEWFFRNRARLRTAVRMTEAAAKSAGLKLKSPLLRIPHDDVPPDAGELRALRSTARESLAAVRADVIRALLPGLHKQWEVHQPVLDGTDTPLALESFRRLNRYVRLTSPRFRDWPYAPDCRYHKREGHQEWSVRQNATVALGYAVLLRGPYDPEPAGGVPRERIRSDLIALLRTITVTHKSNFLPTGDGAPWGDQWQSAFWAGIAGQAAWLGWDQLPDDVRIMTARMVEHEADRFNRRPPDSGWKGDTKAEENAWNSEVIALAACMFPRHPHHDLWTERAIVYMVNSLVRKADLRSDRTVDGKPLRERLCAVTLYPDFTLENHNRVHPDYLASGVLLLRNALLYRAAGVRSPQSMTFNVPETWNVLKSLVSTDGACFYVNGQDWWPHRVDVPLLFSAACSVLLRDREAAFIERACMRTFARMHARFEDGRAWDPREYNYPNAEEEMIARYAELYLLHRMFGDGPEPVSREDFIRARTGTRLFQAGGFLIRRTPRAFASFAWVNGAMGLIWPGEDTWFTAPWERGLVGSIRCRDIREGRPTVVEHRIRKGTEHTPAVVFVRIQRSGGAVEQTGGMTIFPDGRVVWIETWRALRDVEVQDVRSGVLGILNEDAPGIHPNKRVLTAADGRREIIGASSAPERELRISSDWVSIDGRLGVVASARPMIYLDRNRYQRSRLQEILQPLVREHVGAVRAGEVFHAGAVLILPEADADAARAAAQHFRFQRLDNGGAAVRLPDGFLLLNPAPEPLQTEVFGRSVHAPAGNCTWRPVRTK